MIDWYPAHRLGDHDTHCCNIEKRKPLGKHSTFSKIEMPEAQDLQPSKLHLSNIRYCHPTTKDMFTTILHEQGGSRALVEVEESDVGLPSLSSYSLMIWHASSSLKRGPISYRLFL